LSFEKKVFQAKATSYHPIFRVFFYPVHLQQQQLPATIYFLKGSPATSYRPVFESILLFGSIATTAATSYQPVFKYTSSFEKKIFQGKSYQLPSIFQSIL
jgi:hypothetical protein